MAVINQKPNMNQGLWGESGNIETPSSDKIGLGWVVEKPLNVQMNWVQNRQDTMLQYLNQRGIPEWDSLTDYPIDAYTVRSGTVYRALSQNKDKDPTLSDSIWEVSFATHRTGVDLTTEIEKIKNVDGYLSKYVKKSTPYMDSHCYGVSYGVQGSTTTGVFFTTNKNPEIRGGGTYSFNGTSTESNDVLRRLDLDAIIKEALRYKVGDLYLTTNPSNPSTILGYGTWVLYAEGRALVGMSTTSSNPDWTKYIGGVSGDYSHTLSLEEIPAHNHRQNGSTDGGSATGYPMDYNNSPNHQATNVFTDSAGGGKPHNIVQPSMIVAVWRRTA